ncbi:MAG: DUF4268 domain-containing protein [Deltaproteobacteria bacterium]|uniref:DUF4268 domain-containing protein n=1 Tax=Candidatus Zymogenus saltonus TaxID=2844893 RepID=A0A9D8KIK2_9DELT|nr:DUF4268 domain-containing protein [Candidatus Zymogenus saltonus]
MISRIKRLPLRDVWKHEALDFTSWLEDNIDILNEILDLNLTSVEREKEAGSFSVDLVAEDDRGNPVVIENQLEKSDHDHLGKVITYLTAIGAKTAIWIVADPRPEHVNAISWLNESSVASFYLLKVETICIDESSPAPLLTLIVGPSEEGREVGETKKEMAERYMIRHRFWTRLLDYANTKTKLHANISPSESNWIATGAGVRGLSYNYVITKHDSQVELYIDRGKDSANENKAIFDKLFESKENIEESFNGSLEWQRLDDRKASRIRKKILLGGYRDNEDKWPEIYENLVDAMIRLEKSFDPYIKKLQVK